MTNNAKNAKSLAIAQENNRATTNPTNDHGDRAAVSNSTLMQDDWDRKEHAAYRATAAESAGENMKTSTEYGLNSTADAPATDVDAPTAPAGFARAGQGKEEPTGYTGRRKEYSMRPDVGA
ncbi:hypothetical protein DL769_003591 [Monosporascus sp. CRB-8-3]|nr:hypothetical protein DL769_003591 [Monosporascus sp. CRB-8-3]